MTKYYSVERPIGPGTFPRKNEVVSINNFPTKQYCEEIGRSAWGVIIYERPLDRVEEHCYELVFGGEV